ncbi:hypothetical protein [Planktothrix sp. PCC 11201]|uniref:hypothetical protein n=1 Tax=Planktothrix sp. PCC 11201 TaxID=1729650 RepID=UPI00117CBFFC|nr:hypothetical protein [Planktothrix sp. PCC 11201]
MSVAKKITYFLLRSPFFSESVIVLYLEDAIALLIFYRAIIFRTSKIFCYNQFNFDKTMKY